MSQQIDPTASALPTFNRRLFVGLSAGAAAGAGSIAAALAAGTEFGKPHPPIVAEDDPAIVVARPKLVSGGRTVDAYAAAPRESDPTTPGVVVVQQAWGVDAQLRDVVRRFAKEGYVAIAPDLFSGMGAPSGDGATDFTLFRPLIAKLQDEQVDRDVAAAASWIRSGVRAASAPLKIGVTGFCLGGGVTLRQAVDGVPPFAAAAMWYGRVRYERADSSAMDGSPSDPFAYAARVKAPLLASFGARDSNIAAADVRTLASRLTVPHDIKIYDEAGHAFFDDTRPTWVASAAADAWSRTRRWFASYLRGTSS
jgi:carboxymethylenebutenolidase